MTLAFVYVRASPLSPGMFTTPPPTLPRRPREILPSLGFEVWSSHFRGLCVCVWRGLAGKLAGSVLRRGGVGPWVHGEGPLVMRKTTHSQHVRCVLCPRVFRDGRMHPCPMIHGSGKGTHCSRVTFILLCVSLGSFEVESLKAPLCFP